MRPPKTNGLKTDPRTPWDTRSAHSEPCRGGRTVAGVGLPPLNGTPAEQLAWALAVLKETHARVDTMIGMVKELDQQVVRLDRAVADLWRTLTISFAVAAIGLVAGAVCRWWGF